MRTCITARGGARLTTTPDAAHRGSVATVAACGCPPSHSEAALLPLFFFGCRRHGYQQPKKRGRKINWSESLAPGRREDVSRRRDQPAMRSKREWHLPNTPVRG